jgi:hypothetical protein
MRRWLLLICFWGTIWPGLVHSQVRSYYTTTGPTTVLSTELNSLANGAYSAASATLNNEFAGGLGNGALFCSVEGHFVFGSPPTAGTGVAVWFHRCVDGANCDTAFDSDGSPASGKTPALILPVSAGQTDTRVTVQTVCPEGLFKVQVLSDSTGQAMASSGNTVKIKWVSITSD